MRVDIKYLRERANRDGTRRFYWVPSKRLQDAGWAIVSLPPDEAMAIDKAKALNLELDAWYQQGRPRLGAAAPDVAPDGSIPRGSVWELIRAYRNPPTTKLAEDPEKRDGERGVFGYDYAGLEKATKRSYDSALDYIGKWLGPLPARKISETMVMERLKILAAQRHEKGPHAGHRKVATAMLIGRIGRMLFNASRVLFERAHPCYVSTDNNPFKKLGARDSRIHVPVLWTREGRDLMIAAAEKLEWKSIGTAIVINWWLGQREADILKLGHNFSPAEILNVIQSKTAGSVHLPVGMVPEIAAAVEALRDDQRRRNLSGIRLLIDERNGLLWTENRFSQKFAEVRSCAVEEALWCIRTRQPGWEGRDEAWVDRHLADLTFMRLRHTVVTMLYRAGATIPEIAAITGHTIASVTGIIERYGVRDEITAGNAIQKRLDREGV